MIRAGGGRGGDGNAKKPSFPSNTKNKGLKWHTLLGGLLLTDASRHAEVSYSYEGCGNEPHIHRRISDPCSLHCCSHCWAELPCGTLDLPSAYVYLQHSCVLFTIWFAVCKTCKEFK